MKSRILLLLPILFMLLLPSPGFSKEVIRSLEGIVTKISDGDTIQVNSEGTKLKIRLYGIDAPETEKSNKRTGHISKPGQPYGSEAENALDGKIRGQNVRIDVMDIDRYKRLVSIVWMGSRNINSEMVADGWAWAYRQYLDAPYSSEYVNLEQKAREKRLGLWKEHNPQPPWEFRKLNR